MGVKIMIRTGEVAVGAELNDSATARLVVGALPISGRVNRWGEEVYFEVPVNADLETGARAEVEVGEIGYWPTGAAFCVFFGRTPASADDRPRAASAVNIIGKTIDDARRLAAARDGDEVTIEAG